MLASRRVTSQDVARRAGVSRTTVSLVLNEVRGVQISEQTRQRVLQAAKELGYVPEAAARALASRRSQIIGLIITRSPHHIASDAFLTQILNALVETVHQKSMRLLLDIVEDVHHRESYLELARARRIDGIIFSGPRINDEAMQSLEQDGFPTVLMGQLPGSSFCSVDVDNCAAARKAVAHLLESGHRRIGCITNAPLSYTAASDRLLGYRQALQIAGIPFDQELVRYGNFDLESGYLQMSSLLDVLPAISAVFVASDVVAFGAMRAIRERGLSIPEDLALVGFDDVPFARYMDPPLTTVSLPAAELARKSCEILFDLIYKEHPVKCNILLDTQLVVRQSSGAFPSMKN
jgi:LacI family transcriptional regulator